MERIPVSGPWITQKEVDYVADAARNAWYANANMFHDRFEKAFSRYIGVRFAVAIHASGGATTNSGTRITRKYQTTW